MSSFALPRSRVYLADAVHGSVTKDAILVLSGTLFITLSAFIIIPLPFTPVPITLSTLAVLATSAALGSTRGALSAGLYLLLGVAGAPIFSDGQSGLLFPTFGYVIGYVVASVVVGQLARRKADRRFGSTMVLGALGSLVFYVCGVPWLALSLGVNLWQAILLGVVPFLIGDTLKIFALSALLPSAWLLVEKVRPESDEGNH